MTPAANKEIDVATPPEETGSKGSTDAQGSNDFDEELEPLMRFGIKAAAILFGGVVLIGFVSALVAIFA